MSSSVGDFGVNVKKSRAVKDAELAVQAWVEAMISRTKTYCHERIIDTVIVTEVECTQIDCVPVETLIIALAKGGERYTEKILKPVREVTKADVDELTSLFVPRGVKDLVADLKEALAAMSGADVGLSAGYIARQLSGYGVGGILSPLSPQSSSSSAAAPAAPDSSSTLVSMISRPDVPAPATSTKYSGPTRLYGEKSILDIEVRHDKGKTRRGCPCCDPDNIDNILDRILFLETPP